MSLQEFITTLSNNHPPENLSPLLKAMWHDGRGDWNSAHDIAQDVHANDGAWVHAYLHRKEGDEGNAGYWYQRAKKLHSRKPLEEEWKEIVESLLQH